MVESYQESQPLHQGYVTAKMAATPETISPQSL
jgi:hypothetical protein